MALVCKESVQSLTRSGFLCEMSETHESAGRELSRLLLDFSSRGVGLGWNRGYATAGWRVVAQKAARAGWCRAK